MPSNTVPERRVYYWRKLGMGDRPYPDPCAMYPTACRYVDAWVPADRIAELEYDNRKLTAAFRRAADAAERRGPKSVADLRKRIAELEAQVAALLSHSSNRLNEPSFPEDKDTENGHYFCTCVDCGCIFVGHKRRIQCRTCQLEAENAGLRETARREALEEAAQEIELASLGETDADVATNNGLVACFSDKAGCAAILADHIRALTTEAQHDTTD
jgi:hypothetical protein